MTDDRAGTLPDPVRKGSWRRLVIVSLVVVGAIASVVASSRRYAHDEGPFYRDTQHLRMMVQAIVYARKVHATDDGRIDVYRTVFSEAEPTEDNANDLGNESLERGPTVAEIQAGDYTNFPWGRAPAAVLERTGERLPLLWYPAPRHGLRLVGFTDGAVRALTEEEFRALDCER